MVVMGFNRLESSICVETSVVRTVENKLICPFMTLFVYMRLNGIHSFSL